jgi:hypothetical protein
MKAMSRRSIAVVVVLVGIAQSACGSSPPTAPSGDGGASYTGRWSGTTSQGGSISFTVSSSNKVTELAFAYSFGGCSGTRTFSGLALDIATSTPMPGVPNQVPYTGFSHASGPTDQPNYTQVLAEFSSNTAAFGSIGFLDFPGCGSTVAVWSMSKR